MKTQHWVLEAVVPENGPKPKFHLPGESASAQPGVMYAGVGVGAEMSHGSTGTRPPPTLALSRPQSSLANLAALPRLAPSHPPRSPN